jgi:hypothetical protein
MRLISICALLVCSSTQAVKVTSIQKDEPIANASAPSNSTGMVSVKSVLEGNPEFDASVFKMLLVRPDIDHIFLSDVEKLLNGI